MAILEYCNDLVPVPLQIFNYLLFLTTFSTACYLAYSLLVTADSNPFKNFYKNCCENCNELLSCLADRCRNEQSTTANNANNDGNLSLHTNTNKIPNKIAVGSMSPITSPTLITNGNSPVPFDTNSQAQTPQNNNKNDINTNNNATHTDNIAGANTDASKDPNNSNNTANTQAGTATTDIANTEQNLANIQEIQTLQNLQNLIAQNNALSPGSPRSPGSPSSPNVSEEMEELRCEVKFTVFLSLVANLFATIYLIARNICPEWGDFASARKSASSGDWDATIAMIFETNVAMVVSFQLSVIFLFFLLSKRISVILGVFDLEKLQNTAQMSTRTIVMLHIGGITQVAITVTTAVLYFKGGTSEPIAASFILSIVFLVVFVVNLSILLVVSVRKLGDILRKFNQLKTKFLSRTNTLHHSEEKTLQVQSILEKYVPMMKQLLEVFVIVIITTLAGILSSIFQAIFIDLELEGDTGRKESTYYPQIYVFWGTSLVMIFIMFAAAVQIESNSRNYVKYCGGCERLVKTKLLSQCFGINIDIELFETELKTIRRRIRHYHKHKERRRIERSKRGSKSVSRRHRHKGHSRAGKERSRDTTNYQDQTAHSELALAAFESETKSSKKTGKAGADGDGGDERRLEEIMNGPSMNDEMKESMDGDEQESETEVTFSTQPLQEVLPVDIDLEAGTDLDAVLDALTE